MRRYLLACLALLLAASCTPAPAASSASVNQVWCATYKGVAMGCATSEAAALVSITTGGAPGSYVNCNTGPIAFDVAKMGTCATPQAFVWLFSASCSGTDVVSGDLTSCTPLADSVTASLAAEGVDSADVLYVYTWGMGVVLAMWAIGFAAGVAVKAINAV